MSGRPRFRFPFSSWADVRQSTPPLNAQETDTDGFDTAPGGDEGCAYADDPPPNFNGVVHTCVGEIEFEIGWVEKNSGTQSLAFGDSSHLIHEQFSDGQPAAAACCTPLDEYEAGWVEGDETCHLPHTRNCVLDVIQYVCRIPEAWFLERRDSISIWNVGLREALYEAWEAFAKGKKNECIDFFWLTQGFGSESKDYCLPDALGTQPLRWNSSGSWSNLGARVSDVHVELQIRNIRPSSLSGSGASLPEQSCEGIMGNNGLVPEFPGAQGGTEFGLTSTQNLNVVGPAYLGSKVTGRGSISPSGSKLRIDDTGAVPTLRGWSFDAAGSAAVGNSSASYPVHTFRVDLLGTPEFNEPRPGDYRLEQGKVAFHAYANVDGVGEGLAATNSTEIRAVEIPQSSASCPSTSSCWQTRAFTIEYLDASGEIWELDVPAAVWAR